VDGGRPLAQTHVGPGRLTGPYVRGPAGLSPSTGFGELIRVFGENPGVEVAGIEPASSGAQPGLLRAQFTVSLLDPTDLVNKSV
jgi:hypothetical protein